MKWSELYWHRITPLHFLLWPASLLIGLLMAFRRLCYWLDILPSIRLPVPVIVIDSITIEDDGKTPLVIWLINLLKSRGLRPGIISQGFPDNPGEPVSVTINSNPALVGSKSLLLAQRCGGNCPIWVGYDRVAAAQALLAAHPDCNILINDDGLHYHRLQRDLEITTIDYSERNFGNGLMLPAGPLRVSLRRLNHADAVVINSPTNQQFEIKGHPKTYYMALEKNTFRNLSDPDLQACPSDFKTKHLHAITGENNALWFFDHLQQMRLSPELHTYKNNYRYTTKDLEFENADAILMTEEDAVPCLPFANKTYWSLCVNIWIDGQLQQVVLNKIREKFKNTALLNQLVCPLCQKLLQYKPTENNLFCESDQINFPIIDGIPVIQENNEHKLS